MSTLLGDARVRIRPDLTGFESETKSGIGRAMSAAAGVAGAALAAVGVGKFFSDAVKGASDLNETLNKSNVIFGSNAAGIEKWAAGAAKSVGLSKEAALDAAAGLGNMLTQLGFTGDAAAKTSTETVKLAADLGSFNNLPTGDVLERINGALRGEYDSLQAVIPNINAARVEQEALAATGKTAAESLTAQEKAAAVLAIVQRDGAAAANDFAETSDGLANRTKIASAQFDDMKAKLGQALLPAMTAVMGYISEKVIPGFTTVSEGVTAAIAAFRDGADHITSSGLEGSLESVGVHARNAFDVFNENKFVLGAIASAAAAVAIALGVAKVATTTYAVAQGVLNAVMAANPIGIVVLALAGLVGALIFAYNHSETFRNVVNGAWDAIKTTVSFVWNSVLKPILEGFGSLVMTVFKAIAWYYDNILGPVFQLIGAVLKALWDNTISPVLGWIGDRWSTLFNNMKFLWDTVLKPVLDAVGKVIKDDVAPGFDSGVSAIGGAWDRLKDIAKKPVEFVVNKVINDALIDNFNAIAEKFGTEKIKRLSLPFREGGYVSGPGTATSDSINARLSNGEYVIKASAVNRIGVKNLNALNNGLPGFAEGGLFGKIADAIDPAEWLKKTADKLLSAVPGGDTVVGKLARALPGKVVDMVKSKLFEGPAAGAAVETNPGTAPAGGIVALGRWLQSQGISVTEHPAFGGVRGKHSATGGHYTGRAIDVNAGAGTSAREQAILDRYAPLIRAQGFKVIWRAPGHFNHLHASYDTGGILPNGATGINLSGRPERVLTDAQNRAFEELAYGQGAAAPVVGTLNIESTGRLHDDLDEAMFQLRRARRGGVHR